MFDLDCDHYRNGPLTLNVVANQPHITAGENVKYGYGQTPFGSALLVWQDNALLALAFCNNKASQKQGLEHPGYSEKAALAQIQHSWSQVHFTQDDPIATEWITNIFSETQNDIAIKLIGTPFQRRVWRALINVKWGETSSYGNIADAIGHPKAARAVGAATGANRLAWLVPCHRILSKNGTLHNYRWGLSCKTKMLEFEASTGPT